VGANGRVAAAEPVRRATVRLSLELKEYPYKDRRVRGYFAAGNGGQIFMAIPELDLVVVFTGGNYGDATTLRIPQRVLVPDYILPAVN
jgi:CubicO group peptidase (beta-lactamase class C family)